jgi:voltage-gated potassium channel
VIRQLHRLIIGAAPDRRLRLYILLLFVQIVLYSLAVYVIVRYVEQAPFTLLDAVYFVVMTITTVGYGIPFPVESELTIMLMILIMFTGVLTVLLILPALFAPYLEKLFQRTPPKTINRKIRDHVVIIGFSGTARSLIDVLRVSSVDIVLVEDNIDEAREALSMRRTAPYIIWGDYNDDQTWTNAHIDKAAAVILCEDEHTSAKVILGIRDRTKAKIISIADHPNYERFLRFAGAEYVLSPKHVTGKNIARHAIPGPYFETLYDENPYCSLQSQAECASADRKKIFMLPILEGYTCVGMTIGDLNRNNRFNFEILSYWKGSEFVIRPREDDVIDKSTMLFVLGAEKAILNFRFNELKRGIEGGYFAVIAGYGSIGGIALGELKNEGIEAIAIDPYVEDVPGIHENAESEDVLVRAGIREASVCIICTDDDDVNIFTTLMARSLNPRVRILAAAHVPESVDKLYKAGADYVADTPTLGGIMAANIVLADHIHLLIALPDGRKIAAGYIQEKGGFSIDTLQKETGVQVLAVRTRQSSLVHPDPAYIVEEGDEVIAVGTKPALRKLIKITSGESI